MILNVFALLGKESSVEIAGGISGFGHCVGRITRCSFFDIVWLEYRESLSVIRSEIGLHKSIFCE